MSTRRLVLLALLGAAAAPAAARAAIPVAMYPFRVPGLTAAQRADLHGVLEAGLISASRRGILQPRSPALLPATCGDAPSAACLGAAAGEGIVLGGRGELKAGVVLLTAALYDRNGARTREVRFVVDLVIQNLRPIGDALVELEVEIEPDGTVAGGAKQAPPPERDPHGPRPALAAAPPPAPAAPPPLPPRDAAPAVASAAVPAPAPAARPAAKPAAKAAARVDVSAPPPAVWRRQAGPLFTVLGGALLAGGAAVAVVNRSDADDLARKRAGGTLTAADRGAYDRIDRYNLVSAVLLAGGGVSAAAGTWLWITAPARPGDPALAVAGGRF